MKNNPKRQAVTFIELLVSVVILASTIVSIFSLFGSAKRWIEFSQSRMTVGELAKRALDPLQMQVRQDQWGVNCLSTDSCTAAPISIQNRNYNVNYTISNDQPITNLNRVRVDIDWYEPVF